MKPVVDQSKIDNTAARAPGQTKGFAKDLVRRDRTSANNSSTVTVTSIETIFKTPK